MRTTTICQLKNVGFAYDAHPVLKNLSIAFPKERTTVLLGRGGSGKTTLLKLLAGLLSPQSGSVVCLGERLPRKNTKERVAFAQQVGMTFQNSGLFDSWSVHENLAFPLRERGENFQDEEEPIAAVLEQVGLRGSETKYVHELSGGMQKRLGLARALLLNPTLLLLDDPTAGLDPITSRQILELVQEVKEQRKMTLIMVTSDVLRGLALADEVVFLEAGKVLAQSSSEEMKQNSHPSIYRYLRGGRDASV